MRAEAAYYLTEDIAGDDPEVPNNSLEYLLGFDVDLGISSLNLNVQGTGSYILNSDAIDEAGPVANVSSALKTAAQSDATLAATLDASPYAVALPGSKRATELPVRSRRHLYQPRGVGGADRQLEQRPRPSRGFGCHGHRTAGRPRRALRGVRAPRRRPVSGVVGGLRRRCRPVYSVSTTPTTTCSCASSTVSDRLIR